MLGIINYYFNVNVPCVVYEVTGNLSTSLFQYCRPPLLLPQTQFGLFNFSHKNCPKNFLPKLPCVGYWTPLAPNVEDYSSTAARLIATGRGS
ncbi:hypothetical protein Tsubulata_037644 [Turnera subulata]|uniref:Uncharacterized protein n=1 Tax=Turnera subulata TaxID=218843 RepID=A0A9Q0JQV8_9ROSI|nr:hypothetical protein Tsubulata_037644 [Turnera subulata]